MKAKAWKTDWNPSGVKSATYTITGTVATPTFSPDGGTYTSGQNVTINCATPGVTIRYTTSGSDPTESSPQYTPGTAIPISTTTTLKAKAWKMDWSPSGVKAATYTLTGTVATPKFGPDGGTYTSVQNVTISCATPEATIRYTIDGSDPTPSSSLYSSPIPISAPTTILMARAWKTGWEPSAIRSAQYTINIARGGLTVTIAPPEAASAGAKWRRVDTTVWNASGATEAGLPVGSYTMEFSDVPGWTKPTNQPVIINRDQTSALSATYTVKTYTLTVKATGGMVIVNPNKTAYTHGEIVALHAIPVDGYVFSAWSGALSGKTNPVAVIMDADKVITAVFVPLGTPGSG